MTWFRTAVLFLLAGLSSRTNAHVVEQFYAKFLSAPAGWTIEVYFDVGYADPEWRGDPDTPQPTRDWLLARSDEEHAAFRAETETYLRDCIGFSGPDEAVEVDYRFPDFEADPPDFPTRLTGGAYYRVWIEPTSPPPIGTRLWIAQTDTPNFVIEVPDPTGAKPGLVTLAAGESMTLPEGGAIPEEARDPVAHALIEGFRHVIPLGLDHILFILALFLLQRGFRPLLWQSLTFTVAHTVTLGLTAAGIISPRSDWVEPVIALSIVALTVENLIVKEPKPWRYVIVFVFGLIHGMGFANALASIVGEGDGFLIRLVSANLGVELAQVAILAAAWLVTLGWHDTTSYDRFRLAANLAIGATALLWFVQRVS